MDFSLSDEQERYRAGIREVCAKFPDSYWRAVDVERRYPEKFVLALSDGGWLCVLIPTEYGGAGLGIVEACIVLEEINASGGNGAPCHAQMYTMGALLRHGSESQKRRYLPDIAAGRLRLQSMAGTEPEAGSDTSRIARCALVRRTVGRLRSRTDRIRAAHRRQPGRPVSDRPRLHARAGGLPDALAGRDPL